MIKLINEDCLPMLRTKVLKTRCRVITDPPYSEYVHANAVSHSAVRGALKRELGFDSITTNAIEALSIFIGKNSKWACIYSDFEGAHLWQAALRLNARYMRTIPWIRWSMPQLAGDRPSSGAELLVFGHGSPASDDYADFADCVVFGHGDIGLEKKGKPGSWKGPGNLTHFDHKCLRGEGKHKTEKPLDQALDLVEFMSDPGDLIVDPFGGRFTTALACAILGRSCVSYEFNPKTPDEFQKGKARIDAYLKDGTFIYKRDADRLERYRAAKLLRDQDMIRMKEINDRAIAKNKQAKVAKETNGNSANNSPDNSGN